MYFEEDEVEEEEDDEVEEMFRGLGPSDSVSQKESSGASKKMSWCGFWFRISSNRASPVATTVIGPSTR